MKISSPKLPLTTEERANLRQWKTKLSDIAGMEIGQLAQYLQCSLERARYLKGLAEFQAIPSIGPKVAQRVVALGYYSLEEIKLEDGAELINRLELRSGYWEDPCLEDCLRCIVHHANHPGSGKSWPDFTPERKRFRELYGYPASRPTVAWHERREG